MENQVAEILVCDERGDVAYRSAGGAGLEGRAVNVNLRLIIGQAVESSAIIAIAVRASSSRE